MKQTIKQLLQKMKVDPNDPNFKGTPERVERLWKNFLNPELVKKTDFPLVKKGGLIVLRGHEEFGYCPHHLIPVKYTLYFGYLPKHKRVLGASKPLRVFNSVLSTLPLQEDIAPLMLEQLQDLNPHGMGVVIKGEHLCMRMRGVKSPCCDMVTDCFQGLFLYSSEVRQEFFNLIKV